MNFFKKKNTFIDKKILEDHFILEGNTAYAGKHIIIDLWECCFDNKVATLKKILRQAIKISRAKTLHMHMHRFGKELGISGVAVLAESHISVHTWPERKYVAVDIFMCGDTNPELACEYLIKTLKPKKKKIEIIKRGNIKIDKKVHRLVRQ